MLLPVTGCSGGNKKNTVVNATNIRPMMLAVVPKIGPIEKGPLCSRLRPLKRSKEIGTLG